MTTGTTMTATMTTTHDNGDDDNGDDDDDEEEAPPLVDLVSGRFITLLDAAGDGAYNRTRTLATGYGATVQATATAEVGGRDNVFVMGASADLADVDFTTSSEVGSLTPERGVAGLGAPGQPVWPRRRRPVQHRHRHRQPGRGAVPQQHTLGDRPRPPDRVGTLQPGQHRHCRPPRDVARRRARVRALQPRRGRGLPGRRRRVGVRAVLRVEPRPHRGRAELRRPRRAVPGAERLHLRPAPRAGGGAVRRGRAPGPVGRGRLVCHGLSDRHRRRHPVHRLARAHRDRLLPERRRHPADGARPRARAAPTPGLAGTSATGCSTRPSSRRCCCRATRRSTTPPPTRASRSSRATGCPVSRATA